ncbi:18092_t:CDS:2, partial [Gigaspora rosea]
MQVPLTNIPSVLDLHTFDVISPGGGTLSKGMGVAKTYCNWIGRIAVLQDKPLNLCNIEYHGNHDPDYLRTKPLQIANSVRKTITNRTASVTPSILATELMNGAKILSITDTTPKNQVQPTSTRFVPNFETILNALKYDKKLHNPSVLEYEK